MDCWAITMVPGGDDGLSATEKELWTFIKSRPQGEVLIYLKESDESLKDPEILNLIDKIKDLHVYNQFKSTEDLQKQVQKSLASYLKKKGYISTEPFDMRPNLQADYSEIDEKEVLDFLKWRAIKMDVEIPETSIKDVLMNRLGVLKELDGKIKPTNTALLFFSQDASKYIKQHEVRIARFQGVTRIYFLDSQEITGPIYHVLRQVELFFLRNTRMANKIVDFKRVDIPEYPYDAIREGLINAIAHRDYNRTGAPIMFSIFDDRVEISNPGGLLPGLKISELEGRHESRNNKICEIFGHTKDMENFGTGMGKMKRIMTEYGLQEPEFREEGDFFVSRFYGPGDRILDLVSDIPEERMVDLKKLGLNDRQIEALRMMVNEGKVFTRLMYEKTFKISERTAVRDLNGLINKDQIYKIGSSRNIRYVTK